MTSYLLDCKLLRQDVPGKSTKWALILKQAEDMSYKKHFFSLMAFLADDVIKLHQNDMFCA